MNLDILGINILSTTMGAMVLYYFCYLNYALKLKTTKTIIFITTFGILNGLCSTYMLRMGDLVNIIKPIFLLLLSIALIQIFFHTKIYQAFIAFFVYAISLGIGNSILPLLINIFSNKFTTENLLIVPKYFLLVNVASNIIAYLVIFAIRPMRTFVSLMLVKKTILPVLFITFVILMANSGMYYYIQIFNLSAFIIISVLSVLYCVYVIIVSVRLIKHETTKLEIEQQKFYNESLNSTLFNLRRFKHDWSNNLTVINSMLAMNKVNDLKLYLSELISQSLESGNTAIYNIKNAGLFGIISAKLNQAQDKGVTIDFSVIGEVESIPQIKISELCEVIGIFLDNAIEEASMGEKSIKMSIFNDDQFLEISISNSCTNKPDMKMISEVGYSSKGEGRGMGLSIAQKILGKYKNILHISEFEDNTFTQTLTIEKGL